MRVPINYVKFYLGQKLRIAVGVVEGLFYNVFSANFKCQYGKICALSV